MERLYSKITFNCSEQNFPDGSISRLSDPVHLPYYSSEDWIYKNIGKNGLPKIGATLNNGDCLVSFIKKTNLKTILGGRRYNLGIKIENSSVYVSEPKNVNIIVKDIEIKEENGLKIIKIMLRKQKIDEK